MGPNSYIRFRFTVRIVTKCTISDTIMLDRFVASLDCPKIGHFLPLCVF